HQIVGTGTGSGRPVEGLDAIVQHRLQRGVDAQLAVIMRRRVVQWIDGFGIGDVAPEVGRRTDHIRFDYLGDPEIDAVGNGAGQRLLLDVAQVSESASGVEAIERPGEYRGVDDIRPDRLVLPVGSGTLLRVHARGPGQLPRQL